MARMMRTCIACQRTDNHPKKIISVTPTDDVFWHYDCHATVTGCSDCAKIVKDTKGARGFDLVEKLSGERPEEQESD